LNQEHDRHWGDSARADWGNALLVALVLSAAVLTAAMVIAVFNDPARLASRCSATTSELRTTAQDGGTPETDGRAR
jgi:hypothetical protein